MTQPPSPRRQLTPGHGVRTGSLEVVDRIGVGGMAEVYRAIRRKPGKPAEVVVIKKMREEAARNPYFAERFMAEADLVQMLRHPNVVGGHEVGSLDGQPYMVLDYVDGRDLGVVLQALKAKRTVLETAHAVHITMELLRGLGYVHRLKGQGGQELRVVHRDVSPENVLLSYQGDVSLTDFGVALIDGIEMQGDGEPAVGKLGYLAPEQAEQQPVDARTDLFCVGLILYEMALGQPAFPRGKDESEASVLERIADVRVARPSKLDPAFPRDLEKVILTAMERKARNRYPSVLEFLDALDELSFVRVGERELLGTALRGLLWREHETSRLSVDP